MINRELVKALTAKFTSYFLIGLVGLIFDNGFLFIFHVKFGIGATLSAFMSGECGNINNFILNNIFTFKEHKHSTLLHKFLKYHAVVILGTIIGKLLLFPVFNHFLSMHFKGNTSIFIANNMAIAFSMVLNFTLNFFWTWKAHEIHKVTI